MSKTLEDVIKKGCRDIHKAFVDRENERHQRQMRWPRTDRHNRIERRDEMTPRERAENVVRRFVERRATLSKAPATTDEIMNVGMLGGDIEQAITAAVLEEREACAKIANAIWIENANHESRVAAVRIEERVRARCTSPASACNKPDGGTK